MAEVRGVWGELDDLQALILASNPNMGLCVRIQAY